MGVLEGIEEILEKGIESSGGYEGLSESAKDYLQELNVDSKDWESLSDSNQKNVIFDLTERLDELGFDNLESQDKALRDAEIAPEILGEFREEMFNYKISELEKCGQENEISKGQFMEECLEGNEIVSMMDERLGNDCEDGIMNNIKYFKLENGDYALIHDSDGNSNTKAVFSESCVFARSGANENGNMGLNEVLNTKNAASDTTYFVDGRSCYEHDSDGRLVKETTVLTSSFETKSERGSNQTYIRESKDGLEGDDGSHSVQHALGGPNEAINQTPMRGDINRGSEWRGEEQQIVDAVNGGKTVYSEHTYSYKGESRRPTTVSSLTRIEGETSDVKEFDNRVSIESIETGDNKASLEISRDSFSESTRGRLSEAECQYVQEAIDDGSEAMLVQRIDELSGDVFPPKAIDSNSEIDELIGDSKENIDKIFLEAPNDSIQVEQAAEGLSDIEGTKYDDWEKLTLEERAEALQNIEKLVADIAHRPECEITIQNLPDGYYGYYSPGTKEIVINERYIMANNPESHLACLDTILHEGRHAYQDYNMTGRQVHSSPGDISNWFMNEYEYGYRDVGTFGFEAYAMQPVECDARKFAEDILSKFKEQA